ncbi:MAG: MFS transporter [Vicinamibacterales bacterium]
MRTERDARLIYGAAFVRSATVSLVGVTLAIHLADLGFTATQIGLLIGVGLAGSSLATAVVSVRGDTWGRRRVLVGLTLLSAVGAWHSQRLPNATALVPLALVGMLNGMGRDRGAASALEQAILPETVPDDRRTGTGLAQRRAGLWARDWRSWRGHSNHLDGGSGARTEGCASTHIWVLRWRDASLHRAVSLPDGPH